MLAEQDFLLNIPGVARLRVVNGAEIEVEALHDEMDVVPFVLGTGFGALQHQRNTLVLHASAVCHDGGAIALCGPSGAGKSSLSAALCQMGCGFVCDDVAAIHFGSDGNPQVLPDSRQHRLWADVIECLSLAGRRKDAVRSTIDKYHVEPECEPEPMRLSTIVVVGETQCIGDAPSIVRLDLADAASLLRANVFRSNLAGYMGRNGALFGQIAKLLMHVRVLRLRRPSEPERMGEALALLREHVLQQS